MTVDGWVNPLTLETAFSNVYAVGDVTSVGTPKAGVFAEGQASVVAGEFGSSRIRRWFDRTWDSGQPSAIRRNPAPIRRTSEAVQPPQPAGAR